MRIDLLFFSSNAGERCFLARVDRSSNISLICCVANAHGYRCFPCNTGEVSDSDASVSDSSQEEFNDGYDDKLMGDAEDQARLAQMTEKEREQEIFKRIEQREIMKTRFEIEKKLRMAKKQELKKQKESKKKEKGMEEKQKVDRAPDPKERSKDRKKTIEEKQDKKFHAMSLLKARREEKKERGKIVGASILHFRISDSCSFIFRSRLLFLVNDVTGLFVSLRGKRETEDRAAAATVEGHRRRRTGR